MQRKIFHSRFEHSPSQEYLDAVQSLNKLKATEKDVSKGLSLVGSAYSDSVHEDRLQEYMQYYNLKLTPTGRRRCLCMLVGNMKRCGQRIPGGKCVSSGCGDHCYTFTRNGKPFVYVSQPYALTIEDMKSLAEVCEQYDLEATVEAESWHYPAHTLFIEIHHKGWQKELESEG